MSATFPNWLVHANGTVDPDLPFVVTSDVEPDRMTLCIWQRNPATERLTLIDVVHLRGRPGRWTIVPPEE